ncbi:hypothetical protein BIW11_06877 [Tropilaelaps mercedesae]|uniref:Mitochondrial mRNA-processing protein COX24 C-terminal domain-containing protein n=1 Tax=Tropilaelaps mercedesae TaxID=418985 RepID=A0A1V9XW81_9ACAR|nr:hypothetical protein BIW11_06877 [Tropilaelaps mercedesae]
MWRRSLMQVASSAWKGVRSCASVNISSPVPPRPILITLSLTEKNFVSSSLPPIAPLIKAPGISPLRNPVQILPTTIKPDVELPYFRYKEMTLPNLSNVKTPVAEPTAPGNGMHCAVLIQIRKRKMKKHQRKKHKKRMRFYDQKVELRRLKKKEAEFKEELLAKINEAEMFDAEKYIKSVLEKIRNRNANVETDDQRRERIQDLKRKYRSDVAWVKPKLDD